MIRSNDDAERRSPSEHAQYQAKAELFKTLGHPARIHILELLSNLSQQLAVLRRTPLVVSQRNGSEVV